MDEEQEKLEENLERIQELSEMKSRILSIASHEFRTPLAGIMSSLSIIKRYIERDSDEWEKLGSVEKVKNHLEKIEISVRNLNSILNKFLAVGKIEKGEIPVRYTSFDLKEAVELQVSQLQEIAKPGQRIIYSHRGTGTNVILDKYLLRNIINNLISNAIKFSDKGTDIEVYSETGPDAVAIRVRDQGIGIPEDEKDKIFNRFYRAANAISYGEGTGLGLNIVIKYIDLLGGEISLQSEENKGTEFLVTLPEGIMK
jgi:signal transduction histidine kinase